MRAGKLRDSVIVERKGSESTDAYGNPTPGEWSTQIAAQPAMIIPRGGTEEVLADRLTGVIKFEIVVRWSVANSGILASDRFKLARDSAGLPSGTILNIRHTGVDPTRGRKELRFMVESGVAT